MRFRFDFSAEAERDFALIFDHLFERYLGLGESIHVALDHCESRIHDIRRGDDRLAAAPFRGESHHELPLGLRHLTIDRAVYWFEANKAEQQVRTLAFSIGNHDQVRQMLTRHLTLLTGFAVSGAPQQKIIQTVKDSMGHSNGSYATLCTFIARGSVHGTLLPF